MTPEAFIKKWRASTLSERSGAHSHFNDLCALLSVDPPAAVDPEGEWFTFEKGARKSSGGKGWADVWKRGCFAWEYKGEHRTLIAAYAQLKGYADALENPPLLIVSDMSEIRIHTNFTNAVAVQHTIALADLNDPAKRQILKWAFQAPERLRPDITREGITAQAAAALGSLAQKLTKRIGDEHRVAHFVNKLVFCMFAQDIELLPDRIFSELVEEGYKHPELFEDMARELFRAMKSRNGRFGFKAIPWFNGGLFSDEDVLPLTVHEVKEVLEAARLDWSAIEPSIFGSLFERGLKDEKRNRPAAPDGGGSESLVGVHYTDPEKIMKIVEPVVLRPLQAEWEEVKGRITTEMEKKAAVRSPAARTRAENAARDHYLAFRERLGRFRVLDPACGSACGSGNFLYLALLHLKDFDRRVMREAEDLGLPLDGQRVGPEAVCGIEINPYAAELARVTIWIGELQWQMRNGFDVKRQPILRPLDQIQRRDALLNEDDTEAEWPEVDAIIGNPPFLGSKRIITALGEVYVSRLRTVFGGRVPQEADLVTYWFRKAGALIEAGELKRAGLVATNSIRGGASRRVLEWLRQVAVIYDAWDDEPWVIDGAAVRVSLVCFSSPNQGNHQDIRLDGTPVQEIYADLTARLGIKGIDLTLASPLIENAGISFMGDTKGGAFEIPGDIARTWLTLPVNPNGRPM